MKISQIFARRTPRARRPELQPVELLTTWTTRDWADLPVHHPRRD
jgi:hypothetical protein